MPVLYYPAVVERGPVNFGVAFPDLPGCVTVGDTQDEAARNAEEALHAHLGLLHERGFPVPPPSPLDAVERDPEVDEVARVLVRVELPGRAVRVNITVPDDLLAALDRHAARRGLTRSAFLAQAAREAMRRERDAA